MSGTPPCAGLGCMFLREFKRGPQSAFEQSRNRKIDAECKAICATCPTDIVDMCRAIWHDEFIVNGHADFGIWFGTTPVERGDKLTACQGCGARLSRDQVSNRTRWCTIQCHDRHYPPTCRWCTDPYIRTNPQDAYCGDQCRTKARAEQQAKKVSK